MRLRTLLVAAPCLVAVAVAGTVAVSLLPRHTDNAPHPGTKLQSWYDNLDTSKLGDLHQLQRTESIADFAAARAQSLQQAVANADAVVTVTVTGIHSQLAVFDPGPSLTVTYVTAHVEDKLKGSVPSTIIFRQNGGLVPSPDWSAVEIEDVDTEPILLPGDRAILLLNNDSVAASSTTYHAGQYLIEPWTGEYRLDASDSVVPVPLNPFKATVAGEPEAALRTAIKAATS